MDYVKEDFLTPAPYEELYQSSSDPFTHGIKTLEMAEYATSVGFKGFVSMYKKYVQSLKAQQNTIIVDNATMFSGQPLELNAGDWEADDTGVYRRAAFGTEVACPHPVMPVERLVNVDTGEEKLKIAFRKGVVWRNMIVSKTVLANSNKVTDLAGSGIAVTSQTAKSFVQYVFDLENLNYDMIPEKKSIGRLGYIEGDGFSPYVEDLIFDGDAGFKPMFDAISQKGSESEWLKIAKEVRSMSTTAKIFIAASFASTLIQPLGALPFFVHLWSTASGTGKTVALMVAASVWGNPELGAYIKTFNSTSVGMEKTAAFLNNLPFCIDELQLSRDKNTRAGFDVYELAQGVGRNRGNKAGGVDLTPKWHNCILSTGESPITGSSAGSGAINRVIDIECSSTNVVVHDGMRISNAVRRNYGFAGKKFVENLYSPGVLDEARSMYDDVFKDMQNRDSTEKQAMAAALLVVADRYACDWVFGWDETPLTIQEIGEFLKTKASVDAGARSYDFLCDWVAQNYSRFRQTDATVEIYGVLDESGCLAYIIKSAFVSCLQNAGYSPQASVSYLKAHNLIQTRGRNNTKGKRINGVLRECYCLRLPSGQEEEDSETEEKEDLL